jgi:hypothetical protein
MMLGSLEGESGSELLNIPLVCAFSEVFPKDIPELPFEMQDEFAR